MTAFGRSKVDDGRYEVCLEMASVNKRHLDISVRLPGGYQEADELVRRELSSKVLRGQVVVTITIKPIAAELSIPHINWSWLDGRMKALQAICTKYDCGYSHEEACLDLWSRDECFCRESEAISPELETLIKRALESAYEQFDAKRRQEGEFLVEDLRRRATVLRDAILTISEGSQGQVDQIKVRLQELLARHVPSLSLDDRVLREVVLYADKADISEEISRIVHHLNHLEDVLSQEGTCGKLLEFILQELLREFNTLGAKTALATVSTAVVVAKTELEKMREQVQNVE